MIAAAADTARTGGSYGTGGSNLFTIL